MGLVRSNAGFYQYLLEFPSGASEAGRLKDELLGGRWRLTRGQFEFYWSEASRLSGHESAPPVDSAAWSEAAALAWGDFDAIQRPVGGIEEVQHLQMELVEMSRKVQAAQDGLHDYIGAITSASLLIATTIDRSAGRSCRRKVCEASLASRSGSPAMLKLRSTPRTTVAGNSPAVKLEIVCF